MKILAILRNPLIYLSAIKQFISSLCTDQ